MSIRSHIPRPTAKRLSLYLRELESVVDQGQTTISSKQLGTTLGLTDAQVRKDLAYFGQFGHPGIGYKVAELIGQIRKIIGTDRQWNAAIVGAGNIGRALMPYARFRRKGFEIVAVFDADAKVVGTVVAGHKVRPMSDLPTLVRERNILIGIVAVPAPGAQEVANALIAAGVKGILNFAPVRLEVADEVTVMSVDFLLSLEQLAFQISLGMSGHLEDERI
jgi:redox-sensing transcriptional repressor